MIRKLFLALAILALTTTPAFARGGSHGGGGGFHGGDFHGGGFHGNGFDRFHRFHRFGFFGHFGFVGPVFGFGVYPFFWDPFWFPSPYPVYTYAPPLMIQPGP